MSLKGLILAHIHHLQFVVVQPSDLGAGFVSIKHAV